MEFKTLLKSAAIVALSAGFASAQDDATLSVDGEVIKTRAEAPAFAENLDTVYSGWHFRSGETQVLQMDDFENPAFVFVDQGVDLFVHWPGTNPNELAEKVKAINLDDATLSMITNRGIKVWPDGFKETFCTDHWRCRFKVEKGQMDKSTIIALLKLAEGHHLDVIKTENLYTFNGIPAYSLGQGQ